MSVRPASVQYRSLARLRTLALAATVAALSGCAYMPQAQSLQKWWPWGDPNTSAPQTSGASGGPRQASPQEALAPARERKELLVGVTASNVLISFNASEPGKVLTRLNLQGMNPGETFLGIDFRVARGQLFGLTDQGRLLRIDTDKGTVMPVGAPIKLPEGEA